jgi:predicted TIM-barrel fold metal-dependent hydrolase
MPSIIDSHHHIWRRADLSWLNGPMQPRIFGPYESIMRDYLIEEYLDDIDGHNISKSVYVQTNWPVGKAVDEVSWVNDCAERSGWPHAIVAYCDLMNDDVATVLAAENKASSLMRGVRMQLHWHKVPHYRFAEHADIMNEGIFQTNLAKIQDYGWLFELQVFSGQMKNAAKLVKKFPNINFVLIHAGMPEDMGKASFAEWQSGMSRLADNPNCFVKLSGLGTFIHKVSFDHMNEIISSCISIFGVDRCMYGSNFPIEKIWANYSELIGAYNQCLANFSDDVKNKIFHDNAARIYKI